MNLQGQANLGWQPSCAAPRVAGQMGDLHIPRGMSATLAYWNDVIQRGLLALYWLLAYLADATVALVDRPVVYRLGVSGAKTTAAAIVRYAKRATTLFWVVLSPSPVHLALPVRIEPGPLAAKFAQVLSVLQVVLAMAFSNLVTVGGLASRSLDACTLAVSLVLRSMVDAQALCVLSLVLRLVGAQLLRSFLSVLSLTSELFLWMILAPLLLLSVMARFTRACPPINVTYVCMEVG